MLIVGAFGSIMSMSCGGVSGGVSGGFGGFSGVQRLVAPDADELELRAVAGFGQSLLTGDDQDIHDKQQRQCNDDAHCH